MSPSTKKGLIAVAAVVIISGGIIGFYFFRKRNTKKPVEELLPEGVTGTGSQTGTTETKVSANIPKKQTANITKPVASSSGVPIQTQKIQLTRADDVLASGINSANAKPLYSVSDIGAPIYNMNNESVGRKPKNTYLGVVTQARKNEKGGYIVYFLGQGNVKYWTPSSFVAVKTS
jgi:hypothetical protein